MRDTFDAGPIALGTFVAAFVGCACGMAYLLSDGLTTWPRVSPPEDGFGLDYAVDLAPAMAFFSLLGLLLMSPVIAFAVVAAVALRKRISRSPGTWCASAALATWIVGSATLRCGWIGGGPASGHPPLERLWQGLSSSDGQMILVGAVGAGMAFYLMGMLPARRRAPGGT